MSSAAAAAKWVVPPAAGARLSLPAVHASQSVENGRPNDRLRELGFYSLRRKIEDTITRAEIITSTALEVEETKRVKQEVTLRKYHLWDDLSRVDKSLKDLARTMKMVNKLKDLQYKVEEAKLITELADMDAVNHQLLKHAYRTSLDISNFLDHYEMSKLLNGPYEKEGACVIIRAGPEGKTSEIWAEKLLRMYGKWAEKQGYRGRIVERCQSKEGGIVTATIEFESDYLFGFLAGEKGMHRMVQCPSEDSSVSKTYSASVEVIPLFIEGALELQIDDDDLEISYISSHADKSPSSNMASAVVIRHIPSGTAIQSSGERSQFANKIKALNRLKAKLLILGWQQGTKEINNGAATNASNRDTRRYIFHPNKLVQDLKSGIQLPNLNSVLDGNIEPLLRVHISQRYAKESTSAGFHE